MGLVAQEVVWEGEEGSLLNFQPGVNCVFTQYRRRPPLTLDLIKWQSDRNPRSYEGFKHKLFSM